MSEFNREFLSVMARIGCRPDLEDPTRATLRVVPEICTNGRLRAAPLMLLADTVVGMWLETEYEEWTFTTDYSVRLVPGPDPGELVIARRRPLRHGRRLLVEEVDYLDTHENLLGHAVITFMRTPLRDGEVKPDIDVIRRRMGRGEAPTLTRTLVDEVGVEVVDRSRGEVRLDVRDELRRPGGFVQGAMMTLIGEVSAQLLGEHHHGRPCVVEDLDVRYLIGGRTGPLVGDAAWVGEPGRGTIRVEVRDTGRDDVITTTFLARVVPVSTQPPERRSGH